MMLQQNEAVIEREILRAENERSSIESSLQQLSIKGTQQNAEVERSRQELLEAIQQQKVSNDIFRKMCEEALSKTTFERTGQKIRGVRATNDSSALAGFINTSGEEVNIEQDISDVTADNRSFAGAGVIRNLDFNDLRRGV
jgi:hypothetical protein